MVKRAAFIVVLVAFGLLAACATPAPDTGGNPAVYGTQGARMVSDSAATVQAATAAAYQQQFAATAQAQTAANATIGAMLVTRDAQDVRLRDMEIAGMATATAAANSAMATATSIALLREATDAEQEAKLVAQEAAVRATAQAQQIKQAQLENQMREFWVAATPWLTAVVVAILVGGVFSWMMIRASHSLRAPVYTMPIEQNTMTMLRGPNGWQMLPARTVTQADEPVTDGEFFDSTPARWDSFIRWQHPSQLPAGAILSEPRRPLIIDRNENPHILIAGKSGSGKTMSGMIPQILGMWGSSAHVIVINGAGSDFAALQNVPNITFFPQAPEADLIRPLSEFLSMLATQELQRRDRVLAQWNAKNWRELPPQANEAGEMLIAVDEFLAIILAAGGVKRAIMASQEYGSTSERRTAVAEVDHMVYTLWSAAGTLASKSRKHGIHLLLTLTDPTADLLGKDGMMLRRQSVAIGFRMNSADGSRKFVGVDGRNDGYPQGTVGLPTGQFLVNMDGVVHRCVSFYPSPADIQAFVQARAPFVSQNDLPLSLQPGDVITGQWADIRSATPTAVLPPSSNMRSQVEMDADFLRGKLAGLRNITAVGRRLGRIRGDLTVDSPSGKMIDDARNALQYLAAQGDPEAKMLLDMINSN